MAENLKLTAVMRRFIQNADLFDGIVKPEGIDIELLDVKPAIQGYRRMVRNAEFDICALAPTTYYIARGYGAPFKALPVFLSRRFHHKGLLVRPDSGITTPKDLEGKNVGVRAYSVTTGVWTRGILENEYGVDTSKVTWWVDDEEHVTQLKLPGNVKHVPEGKSLASMMASGELQAGFAANAGIGREGPPKDGWDAPKPKLSYPELFPNGDELGAEWYTRTGILPFHGVIVVRDEVLKEHPWVAKSLYDAFSKAHANWLARFNAGASSKDDDKARAMVPVVGPDPLPNGIKENLPTIEALAKYAHQQGLIPKPMAVEDLFIDPEAL